MRIPTFMILAALAAAFAAEGLDAQRPRFVRRQRPEPEAQPEAEPEEEKSDKVENWMAVQGADVYIGTGQVIRRATVLVGDDKIHAVGHDIELPEGTKVIDATGKVVSPGFVITQASRIGASSPDPATYNPFDPTIKRGLAVGITTYMIGSPRGNEKPGGSTGVLKLAYGDLDGMEVAQKTALGMRVPLSPQQMDAFEQLVKKTREHKKAMEEWTEAVAKDPKAKKPKAPPRSEELQKIMDGETRLWIDGANDRSEIQQACEIAQLLGTGVVLNDPVTAWTMPDAIAATGSMVILNPRENVAPDPTDPENTGSNIASAAILSAAGVPVAVTPPGGRFGGAGLGTGGIMGQDLNTPHIDAAYAVRGGMDNRNALRTITLDAAKMIGVDDRVGSIEVGKDADLLILDGDPLHYRTFVETAIVNGKVVYEKDKEPYYSHIRR